MRTVRTTIVCLAALLLATLVSGAALAKSGTPAAPKNLRGFLLRPSESFTQVFPRTPAFAWSPVRGARCYEFELATSKSFTESSLVWSNVNYNVGPKSRCQTMPVTIGSSSDPATGSTGSSASSSSSTTTTTDPAVPDKIAPLRVPAVSVNLALPWFTGKPFALYAHVRAVTATGPTRWSSSFAFNMRWPSVPTPLVSRPGLVRWAPVEGATSYQVWYPDIDKVVTTHTNVADEREFYTFHATTTWVGTVHWRVRAVRKVVGSLPNGLPAVSYGPWSPLYSASNPAPATGGKLTLSVATADNVSSPSAPKAMRLMPALTFSGTVGLDGRSYSLFRTYASTDADCVNIVYRGSVVGSPAFAPRTTGPLNLPTSDTDFDAATNGTLADASKEPASLMADTSKTTSVETAAAGSSGSSSSSTSGSGTDASASTEAAVAARVDLPDVDFPNTRYYWTVVPVVINVSDAGVWTYVDAEMPQDACAAGRVASFGKESAEVVAGSRTPYLSGLTPSGRLLAVSSPRPQLYSTPLIAWQPAEGATKYEVQWSRSPYPWKPVGNKVTYSTSAVVSLAPGTWYYRIRGINEVRVGKPEMPWSKTVVVKIATPKFTVVRG